MGQAVRRRRACASKLAPPDLRVALGVAEPAAAPAAEPHRGRPRPLGRPGRRERNERSSPRPPSPAETGSGCRASGRHPHDCCDSLDLPSALQFSLWLVEVVVASACCAGDLAARLVGRLQASPRSFARCFQLGPPAPAVNPRDIMPASPSGSATRASHAPAILIGELDDQHRLEAVDQAGPRIRAARTRDCPGLAGRRQVCARGDRRRIAADRRHQLLGQQRVAELPARGSPAALAGLGPPVEAAVGVEAWRSARRTAGSQVRSELHPRAEPVEQRQPWPGSTAAPGIVACGRARSRAWSIRTLGDAGRAARRGRRELAGALDHPGPSASPCGRQGRCGLVPDVVEVSSWDFMDLPPCDDLTPLESGVLAGLAAREGSPPGCQTQPAATTFDGWISRG